MFISLSALSLCDEKYYIRFRRILQVFFEKISEDDFPEDPAGEVISPPCALQQKRTAFAILFISFISYIRSPAMPKTLR